MTQVNSSGPNKLVVDPIVGGYYLRWERWGADPRLTRAARYALSRSPLWYRQSAEGYYVFRTQAVADRALAVANEAIDRHRVRIDLA